jgi:predicted enzyme related to lactoylglutathione lyase
MHPLITWTEIPAADLARAKRFYAAVLDATFADLALGDLAYAMFLPAAAGTPPAAALVAGPGYRPSTSGVTIYLNGAPDLAAILDRVAAHGGTVLMPKTWLSPEAGHAGFFTDSEGNRIGLQHP